MISHAWSIVSRKDYVSYVSNQIIQHNQRFFALTNQSSSNDWSFAIRKVGSNLMSLANDQALFSPQRCPIWWLAACIIPDTISVRAVLLAR
jgi:fumarate hydratase class II